MAAFATIWTLLCRLSGPFPVTTRRIAANIVLRKDSIRVQLSGYNDVAAIRGKTI